MWGHLKKIKKLKAKNKKRSEFACRWIESVKYLMNTFNEELI
jgi:hypothetical protein